MLQPSLWLLVITLGVVPQTAEESVSLPEPVRQLLTTHCAECHTGESPEADLNIDDLLDSGISPQNLSRWTLLYDRTIAGEMPPDKPLSDSDSKQLTEPLYQSLLTADKAIIASQGRSKIRRMNRLEFENALRDLLQAPWLQIKTILPEDAEAFRFNKVGDALDISHVNMARYLQAVDYALREVLAKTEDAPNARTERYYARQQGAFNRKVHYNPFNRSPERATFPLIGYEADLNVLNDEKHPFTVGNSDPEKRELESFGVVASSYEPLEPTFNSFKAPLSGRYKLRIKGYTFWVGGEEKKFWRPDRTKTSIGRRPEPVAIYAQSPPRQLRKLGEFDLQVEPSVQELDVYLLQGETIRPDPVRLFRSRPPNWKNPLATEDGMPGVAYNYLEVEGPLVEQWPSAGHRLLFDDLPLQTVDKDHTEVQSANPAIDAQRLLERFLERAYQHSPDQEQKEALLRVFAKAEAAGFSFQDSMIAMYTAALCSPNYLCIDEPSGPLESVAIANRLSLFLWNRPADQSLRQFAREHDLRDSSVLRSQVKLMLQDPRMQEFIAAFTDYWLDLRKLNDTSPDEQLYPDYYLDDALVDSAQAETQLFFTDLLKNNLPIGNLIQADFTYLNERLAVHYGIPDIAGTEMRRVELPPQSPRGGLLTQASILKVTSNGTTTSPVVRGAWINERILGVRIPPPPKSVPAIEPDTRGATTIREQLQKHRADPACASCHQIMDPVGFALENFDVLGGWRDRYRSLGEQGEPLKGFGKNGQPFIFRAGPTVDASGELLDKTSFKDIYELRNLLSHNDRDLARNLLEKLAIFATGSAPHISDREELERILNDLAAKDYPVQTLIEELVCSPLFLRK